ncbi:MAG: hypothetical protein A3F54_04785 [Candidatus Kerfeldbacteria bacterium RIFCSPHIGHO2_12_FULL_48_17]|uniref:L,D-TPase catalytic domain-containing protein n=1 Tax=Candidatus Kerfeldbacteria bacterium RIFCSPHIGHO2_12_FULL_48_17 TaxID=1798542 RepID=A0A1G2B0W6_9BACT|nr:MAG: hypothetical protein A3F54_04785 [Candidatus Kerfeldbacteria bacterium RIFCSPHIGHO2_12_FULL_48_17]
MKSYFFYNPKRIFGAAILTMITLMPVGVHASETRAPEVRIFRSADHAQQTSFYAYDQGFRGGADVAFGDFGGDGVYEMVTGPGTGGGPDIRLFRADGSFITHFLAYEPNFNKGVKVATGDLDGDGKDEIVTGTRTGGGPYIRIFDGNGMPKFTPGFYAFDPKYHGGVDIAVGDIDGDGTDDIIIATGQEALAHVKVYNRFGYPMTDSEFHPFDWNFQGGISVAAANVDGGPEDEIIMGVAAYGQSWVKVYKTNREQTVLGNWKVFADDFTGGVNVAGGDVDNDGMDEVLVGVGANGSSHIRVFEGYGREIGGAFFAYENEYQGGVFLDAQDLNGDGGAEIITGPNRFIATFGVDDRPDLAQYAKYIDINISEQKLYAFENGKLVRSFLISSGIPGFESPRGEFEVFRKLLNHDYRWTYGGNLSYLSYNIPNVKYNLNFTPNYYIHYAYWHNDFGKKKSHGCINVDLTNSEWIYNWAPVGTKVKIHD